MKTRALKVIRYILCLLTTGLAYAFFVSRTGFAIPCIIHYFTGYQCPGCGISRMCLAIMKLDFISAYNYNKLLFIISPFLIYIIIYLLYRYIRYNDAKTTKAQTVILYTLLVLLFIWGIVRNI